MSKGRLVSERDLRGDCPGGENPRSARAEIVRRVSHNPMTEQTLQTFEASIVSATAP
jgi:hypothetical protein